MKIKESTKLTSICLGLLLFVLSSSCDELLEIDNPKSLVEKDVVFRDDITATSAVTGMYATMITNTGNFASGSGLSLTALAALSADDFANYLPTNIEANQFYENNLLPDNSQVLNIWRSAYGVIYQANAVIAGLNGSVGVSPSVKEQLMGEALFIRAFCHFYLVNTFGKIPLVTSVDYRVNTNLQRSEIVEVYNQILADLVDAQSSLQQSYPTIERVRPNKAVATAFLARVNLYLGNWSDAEMLASELIENDLYQLEGDINNVFLATSAEAIWQLRPTMPTFNTWEGNAFILTGTPESYYLTPDLVESFESGDLRLLNWIGSVEGSSGIFYFPFKYKIMTGGPGSGAPVPLSEYSTVMRLAEQYLIRAEARAHQDNLMGAIADVDTIRDRANLPLIRDTNPTIGSEDLLFAIERERRCEFFVEWGHRWFDIKRTNRALSVLGSKKPNFSDSDLLYPIPANEIINNPKLGR